jgi:adenylylsulfate kinase
MTGLSGAGKTTLSRNVKDKLLRLGYQVEIIDGDEYRAALCKDLGFSKEDRFENIRRLGFVGKTLVRNGVIVLLAAVNPYEKIRREIKGGSPNAKTVWIDCDLETLLKRDTKGLYRRALLPDDHPDKLRNLTGVNDPFEDPQDAELIVKTDSETIDKSTAKLTGFILRSIEGNTDKRPRAFFIGRWQPFHNGHKWLIEQKLNKQLPVLIAVRDVEPDSHNPLTTTQTVEILHKIYANEDVEIITIPNIESVNFGRGVGYEINEFTPPPEIGSISATEIRKLLRNKSDEWKQYVDERIHDLIAKYLA